jgi:hypothetical protein|tara:strand:- start:1565 stop:1714 length:150 start_codon:yes stop_codon:yes gene_type:complete
MKTENLTGDFERWQEQTRWERRMRHLNFFVKIMAVAFALSYVAIIVEIF